MTLRFLTNHGLGINSYRWQVGTVRSSLILNWSATHSWLWLVIFKTSSQLLSHIDKMHMKVGAWANYPQHFFLPFWLPLSALPTRHLPAHCLRHRAFPSLSLFPACWSVPGWVNPLETRLILRIDSPWCVCRLEHEGPQSVSGIKREKKRRELNCAREVRAIVLLMK